MSTGVFPSPQTLSNLQNTLQTFSTGSSITLGNSIGIFLTKLDQTSWNKMNIDIQAFIAQYTAGSYPNLRVVITLSDGTVAYDSGVGVLNTFSGFINKTINENHNSRVAIMTALLSKIGSGYEIKYSNTIGKREAYNALRMGISSDDSLGCCRVSYQYTL
jgi:hypothetical protein